MKKHPKLFRLTAAGIILLKEAREIRSALERIERDVRSINKIRKDPLKIGLAPTAFFTRFSSILDDFRDSFPHVKVEFYQDSKAEILDGLLHGRLDIGFLDAMTKYKGLKSDLVHDEAVGALFNRKHRLAKRKEVQVSDLANETIILHPRADAPEFHDKILKMIQAVEPRAKIYIKSENEVCPILVATGKGVSLTVVASNAFAPKDTVFVPMRNLFRPVSVFWREDAMSPSLKVFLEFVLERYARENARAKCLMDSARITPQTVANR